MRTILPRLTDLYLPFLGSPSRDGREEYVAPELACETRDERTMHFVMLPSKTLRDADASPLSIRKNAKDARLFGIKVAFRDPLQKRFGQDDVPEGEREWRTYRYSH